MAKRRKPSDLKPCSVTIRPGAVDLERIVPIGIDVLRHEIKRAQIATLYTSWFADRGPIERETETDAAAIEASPGDR